MMTMHRHLMLLTACGSALLTGCAGFELYADSALSTRAGIPIPYGQRPYLVVKRTGVAEKPVEVSIEYISDPAKFVYAVPRGGFGNANLSLAFGANGQLTAFGQTTDPKLVELVTSLGGLITARAGAVKTLADAALTRSQIKSPLQSAQSMAAAADQIDAVAGQVASAVAQPGRNGIEPQALASLQSTRTTLVNAAKVLRDPSFVVVAPQQLELVKREIGVLQNLAGANAVLRGAGPGLVRGWAAQLQATVQAAESEAPLMAEAGPEPVFEVYEILQDAAGTSLQRVMAR